ncbi:hypothetical protein HYU95_02065 [Candidatus Daviesbacteria bacterium]|nr:hypothetical protein [Candidatus Daviesbacteria bacterium]
MRKLIIYSFLLLLFLLFTVTSNLSPVLAIVDPLAVPNNRFGIHIIQATPDESSPAASLVNTNGDWGYVTVLIESKDRNHNKWQEFFNDLRRRHLIPIVRLATEPEGNFWKRPYEGEELAWADFLDTLNWPTKNRYIIIYNEPNHAKEWGNKVDASDYAKTLDKTITALKNKHSLISSQGSEIKNSDFFVLNGGFDASAPSKMPEYEDQVNFMQKMDEAVPGIFEKLDGWVSHSYPNPGFIGSPDGIGRGTVRTYFWEIQQLRNLGVNKNLPIFITETGWKHAEGLNYNRNLPDAETVAKYFQQAFENVWNTTRIVAVTPFLLSYQESPFDHFSFKKIGAEKQYYPMYTAISDLQKITGKPIQQNMAQLISGEIYSSIVSGENYTVSLTFKNTGQSIWNDPLDPSKQVKLVATEGSRELGITTAELPKDTAIQPGQEFTFKLGLKAPQSGTFKVVLNLLNGEKQFDSESLKFTTTVKSPVILKIKGALLWKDDFSGNYILSIKGATGENSQNVTLDKGGVSSEIEAKYLLPDYKFDFILEKPFYKPTRLQKTVYTGVNILDFGKLEPDMLSAIFNPAKLWKLLPFSK